ncbi:PD-(D/E)XK nuclease family protein [Roseomonas nepalensis]|uniref:PD-(D/E)XK nuclease family protein n=1 Tax=Muricoccus nepalensis TaxID=1854500 RepID=A0A502FVX8_9PROT|nr:PD-(D/E)XK nuclease family protein [Roseomonas nepalensis]TPG53645.1 PD-(D/E)XK nuclease family protein [Roseomonas nepalensis]
MLRRTIVVAARPQFEAARLDLARSGAGNGARVTPIEGLAARLAGGLLSPVQPDLLVESVSDALRAATDEQLGDLAEIRHLPGVPKTLATSLRRAWDADLDLEAHAGRHPRLAALARIEAAVLDRLPKGQLKPADLVRRALGRLEHAPAMVGAVELRHLPDLAPCWRGLVEGLATVVPVCWDAGPFPVPTWIVSSGVEVRRAAPRHPATRTVSCASPRHEVVEAMRWARSLIASGVAKPDEIAIAAASTTPYDDFVASLSEECLIPVHFGHGRNALHTPDGQAAAALADVLLRGLSRERVRRAVSLSGAVGSPEFKDLPADWSRRLPPSAPLGAPEYWRHALGRDGDEAVASVILPFVEKLAAGPDGAAELGERLLRGPSRELWRRALMQAPATALDRELASIRLPEDRERDQAACVMWMPASALASCPRPYVWLLGLNAQSWPRPSTEDPLLPRRVLDGFVLEETTISAADRRSFLAIQASAGAQVVRSFSRREAGGRRLGVSPLVTEQEPELLYRTGIPRHAMSEPDRLMARPDEFSATEEAGRADECWRAWRHPNITTHDGLVARRSHPAIVAALRRTQSATSLAMLLRNPIGFMWTYALGMRAPEIDSAPLEMDGRAFGDLVHQVLDAVVPDLPRGSTALDSGTVERLVADKLTELAIRWEQEQPVPPMLLWRRTLDEVGAVASNALLYPLDPLPGQRSYSEVPFGSLARPEGKEAPWDTTAAVPVPGTGLTVGGRIDRVDVAGDGSRARVVDYKTGRFKRRYELRGGREVQRCLYAFAVEALLSGEAIIDTGLLYPSKEAGAPTEGEYDPLDDPKAAMGKLTQALAAAEANMLNGLALPGVAAGSRYKDERNPKSNAQGEVDDLGFALPVVPGTMLGPKKSAARELLGPDITAFWDVP